MTLGPVRVMGAGVVVIVCAEEVIHATCCVSAILQISALIRISVPCPSLTDPGNGAMDCSLGDDGVPSYEDTCSFTCNTGYELTNSDTRTCQSDGSWNGSDVACNRGT